MIYPGSFMKGVFQITPKILHLGVVLQFPSGFYIFDAILHNSLGKFIKNHGIHTLVMVLFINGNQKQVDGVVFLQGFKQMHPAERKHVSFCFLHGLGKRRESHAKSYHLIVTVKNDTEVIYIDIAQKLLA